MDLAKEMNKLAKESKERLSAEYINHLYEGIKEQAEEGFFKTWIDIEHFLTDEDVEYIIERLKSEGFRVIYDEGWKDIKISWE